MERWKTITGFPDYEVSDCGRVKRVTPGRGTRAGKIVGKNVSQNGYFRVCLTNDGQHYWVLVHRIVAAEFLGQQPSVIHEVRHLDGDKLNNKSSNLSWGTRADNEADKVLHGRSNQGERHGMSSLTNSQVLAMRSMHKRGHTSKQIAEKFGISSRHVRSIVSRRAWRHVK